MINEDKVKLMTKIQLFKDEEKEAMKVNRYYRRDYLGLHLIRSFFAYLALFLLILAIIFLYNWEDLLTEMDIPTLILAGRWILFSFILLLIPAMIVSYIRYWFHYRENRRKAREYVANLKQLNAYYQKTDSGELSNTTEIIFRDTGTISIDE